MNKRSGAAGEKGRQPKRWASPGAVAGARDPRWGSGRAGSGSRAAAPAEGRTPGPAPADAGRQRGRRARGSARGGARAPGRPGRGPGSPRPAPGSPRPAPRGRHSPAGRTGRCPPDFLQGSRSPFSLFATQNPATINRSLVCFWESEARRAAQARGRGRGRRAGGRRRSLHGRGGRQDPGRRPRLRPRPRAPPRACTSGPEQGPRRRREWSPEREAARQR